VYGASKLKGEQLCLQTAPETIIIRTAWVYSSFGNNFVKTMIRLMQTRPAINVVNDQVGAPTYAADLAQCIMQIIDNTHPDSNRESISQWRPGIYHYSNQGRISWFDFAVAIKEGTGSSCTVNPIPAKDYPTPAKRPSFSLLDTGKIRQTFAITIPEWKDSLQQCLKQLNRK
jgi:dTDP-4-dehydrorhamnose reductase